MADPKRPYNPFPAANFNSPFARLWKPFADINKITRSSLPLSQTNGSYFISNGIGLWMTALTSAVRYKEKKMTSGKFPDKSLSCLLAGLHCLNGIRKYCNKKKVTIFVVVFPRSLKEFK